MGRRPVSASKPKSWNRKLLLTDFVCLMSIIFLPAFKVKEYARQCRERGICANRPKLIITKEILVKITQLNPTKPYLRQPSLRHMGSCSLKQRKLSSLKQRISRSKSQETQDWAHRISIVYAWRLSSTASILVALHCFNLGPFFQHKTYSQVKRVLVDKMGSFDRLKGCGLLACYLAGAKTALF